MQSEKDILRLIGRREFVDFPTLGISGIEAKIDTGAYTSSLHCDSISIGQSSGKTVLRFTVKFQNEKDAEIREYVFDEFSRKKIKNSFGEMEERYIIKTIIKIGQKSILSRLSLTNRGNMRYPVLIGRKPLKGKFLIDVKAVHLGGKALRVEIL
jgi:hypothetical protein